MSNKVKRSAQQLGSNGNGNSNRRLQAAGRAATASPIVITDPAGLVQWVNPAFTRLTGYTADEVIGRTPRLWSAGGHGREYYKNLWDTILAGQVRHGENLGPRRNTELCSYQQGCHGAQTCPGGTAAAERGKVPKAPGGPPRRNVDGV